MAFDDVYDPPAALLDATCAVCPAQVLRFGRFDVAPGPNEQTRYLPEKGWRVNVESGAPTCVHPFRVGLPAALYRTQNLPVPHDPERPVPRVSDVELPEDVTLLEGWMVAVLRTSAPEAMASALFQAEAIANRRFASRDVLAALRRVMSRELAG